MAWFMTPFGPQSVIEPANIHEFRRRDYLELTDQQAADYFAGVAEIPDVSFVTGQELPGAMAAAAADTSSAFAVAQRTASVAAVRESTVVTDALAANSTVANAAATAVTSAAATAGLLDTAKLIPPSAGRFVTEQPDLLVYDRFRRPDTASTLGWSESGSLWKGSSGVKISDQAVTAVTGTGNVLPALQCHVADVAHRARFTAPATGNFTAGLMLRRTDPWPTLIVVAQKTGASGTANTLVLNLATASSGWTVLARVDDYGWADGASFALEAKVVGKVVTVSVDGVVKLTHTLSDANHATLTGTEVGLMFGRSTDTGTRIEKVETERKSPRRGALFLRAVAHRSQLAAMPENSLVSLSRLPLSVREVEIDIQVTADGQFVLMHDSTIDRTTNGSGAVNSLTLAQLRQYEIDDNGGPIPTLAEYLAAVARMPQITSIWCDYASGNITQIVNQLIASPIASRCIFFTGNIPEIATARAASSTIRLALGSVTTTNITDPLAAASTYNIEALLIAPGGYTANSSVIPQITAAGRQAGISVEALAQVWTAAAAQGATISLGDYAALVNK